jgi:VanZ family protein
LGRGSGQDILLNPSANVSQSLTRPAAGITAALLIIAGVLYGSLIPFGFNLSAYTWGNGLGLLGLRWRSAPWDDILTNVLVYLPVGASLFLARLHGARRSRTSFGVRRRCLAVFNAVLAGSLVSVLAESLQAGLPERQSSWTDVVLNTLGTFLGGILACLLQPRAGRVLNFLGGAFRRRPCSALAHVLAATLLFHQLFPFDFVTDTSELHQSFRRAQWIPAPLKAFGLFEAATCSPILSELAAAGAFAFLGYFSVLSGRERGESAGFAFVSATTHSAVLAALIETLQLFTASHCFKLVPIVLRPVGATFGAWFGIFILDRLTGSAWRHRRRLIMPTAILSALIVTQIAYDFGTHLGFQPMIPIPVNLSPGLSLPFEGLWRLPLSHALHNAGMSMMGFGILTLSLSILIRRARMDYEWLLAGGVVVGLAFLNQFLDRASHSEPLDLTDPLLAMLAVSVTAIIYESLLRERPLPQPVAPLAR